MEVLSDVCRYNARQSLPFEKIETSVGNFLQHPNDTLQEYSQVGKKLSVRTNIDLPVRQNNRASTAGFYPGDTGCRSVYRASTGTLPQSKKASLRALQSGYRASTGGLKSARSFSTRRSHQHIIAKDLKNAYPISENIESDQEVKDSSQCDRCGGLIQLRYFKCVNCPRFRLCAECGDGGIYCQDDLHSWVEKSPLYTGVKAQVIGKISSGEARTLFYGTKTFPSIFRSPSSLDTPETLFNNEHRFIRKTNPREIMIYSNGACIRNLKTGSVAGWAFVYRPSAYTQDGLLTHAGTISGRLEMKGPTGKIYTPTSNRAELRSTLAALQFLDWSKDCNRGWRSIVIATDSEYVTCSITKWIADWEDTNWKLVNQEDVHNKDLWELLLKVVRKYHAEGVKIAFWRVPRRCNSRAYEYAKKATGRGYKERIETVIFQPDGPVKVRVSPFKSEQE